MIRRSVRRSRRRARAWRRRRRDRAFRFRKRQPGECPPQFRRIVRGFGEVFTGSRPRQTRGGFAGTSLCCPVDVVIPRASARCVARIRARVNAVTLADTTGMATPRQVEGCVNSCESAGRSRLARTPHTRGVLANVLRGSPRRTHYEGCSADWAMPVRAGATETSHRRLVHMLTEGLRPGSISTVARDIAALGRDVDRASGQVVKAARRPDLQPSPREFDVARFVDSSLASLQVR